MAGPRTARSRLSIPATQKGGARTRDARKYGAILIRDRRRPVACITPASEEAEVNRFGEVQAAFPRLTRGAFGRSLDATHLVTARAEGFERIYWHDRHVLDAARSFGLEGVNPISR